MVTVSHPTQQVGQLKTRCSHSNGSLHLHADTVHCRAIWVHANASKRGGAGGSRWAVTTDDAACQTAVLLASVLILEDALRHWVGHALWEVRRAATGSVALGGAQRASTLKVTCNLIIEARRGLVMVLSAWRSWRWCWCGRRSWRRRGGGWGRARSTAHSWVGWRAICNAALVDTTLDQHVAIHTPAGSPRVLHLPVVLATVSSKPTARTPWSRLVPQFPVRTPPLYIWKDI